MEGERIPYPLPSPYCDMVQEVAPDVDAYWTGSFHGLGVHYSDIYGKATQWGNFALFQRFGLKQTGLRGRRVRFYGFAWKSDLGPLIGTGETLWTFGGREQLPFANLDMK